MLRVPVKSLKFALWQLVAYVLFCFMLQTNAAAATNQPLDDQITMLAKDIRGAMESDRTLKGHRLRLESPAGAGIPMANFDYYIEQALTKHLNDLLDSSSALCLTVECSYLVSESRTNGGNQVIQLTAKISEGGRPKLIRRAEADVGKESIMREVNNSTDIGRVLGVTYAPPDSTDHKLRLDATQNAFNHPTCKLLDRTRVTLPDKPVYAVEIRRKAANHRDFSPAPMNDQQGWAYAPIQVGDVYQIALYNYSARNDVVAKIEIDGLDVATTFCIDRDAEGKSLVNGYVVPRSTNNVPGSHLIPGWLHTTSQGSHNVYEFVVNELGKGAASALKAKGEIGVITVRFFEACRPDETIAPRSFGETGVGQARRFDYHKVDLKFHDQPDAIVSVRYNR